MTQQDILARLRRLPGGVFWLLGWLCACVGAVCFAYYWRVWLFTQAPGKLSTSLATSSG